MRFFSDLFLFADACDEAWIGNCLIDDERPKSIEPVLTFNAGVVGARGLFDELKTQVPQPVLVIEGAADKRSAKRGGYAETVPDLERGEIDGSCNVPPWERPGLVADAIGALVLRARRLGQVQRGGIGEFPILVALAGKAAHGAQPRQRILARLTRRVHTAAQ